jgi:hypothetical protein
MVVFFVLKVVIIIQLSVGSRNQLVSENNPLPVYIVGGDVPTKSVAFSTYRVHEDENGIFQSIEWKRTDGTLAKKSTLSGGTSPLYEKRIVTHYDTDGITVTETVAYDQFYNDRGKWTHEVIADE